MYFMLIGSAINKKKKFYSFTLFYKDFICGANDIDRGTVPKLPTDSVRLTVWDRKVPRVTKLTGGTVCSEPDLFILWQDDLTQW